MAWLADWLKSLILIVVVASFVELLLPNRSMQRYVKTVISLFLLTVLLSPVFKLFEREWDADKLLAAAQRLAAERFSAGLDGPPQSIGQIWREAEKLQRHNEQLALSMVEQQLAAAISGDLDRSGIATPASVEVRARPDDGAGLVIEQVTVRLSGAAPFPSAPPVSTGDEPASAGRQPPLDSATADSPVPASPVRPIRPVEPVEPVTIVIEPIGGRTAGSAEETAAAAADRRSGQAAAQATVFAELSARVREHIARAWQLTPGQIEVVWEGR